MRDLVDVGALVTGATSLVAGLDTVRDCEDFVAEGLPLGRLVRISAAWFLSRGTLPDTRPVLHTYRSFLVSGIVVASAARAMLDRVRPDRVFMLNGTFFAESIMIALATQRGLPYTTYERGFVQDSVVMTPNAAACYLMVPDESWARARDVALSHEEAEAVEAYLGQRSRGEGTLDNFWRDRVENVPQIRHELRLDADRRLAVMFCNVLWDSAVLERDVCFQSMSDWVVAGIRWAATHPELDLVVRIHPGEVQLTNHPTRERMDDQIATRLPSLPHNVRVVAADDPISSYVLMDEATVGLVYSSTVGLELATRGIPVIVAAEAHYRGRGFTMDPVTAEEYWTAADRVLHSPPEPTERERTRRLALRYAALFFFRFHNTLDAVHEEGRSRPRVRAQYASELDPGHDVALDRLVAGILEGVPPVAPAGAPQGTGAHHVPWPDRA
ncbi:MAG: hypothetical protein ACRDNK_05835 [Solirubrobacteraceae bacterium]